MVCPFCYLYCIAQLVRFSLKNIWPGVAGALSSVWREWVNWLVEFGIEPDAIVAVPYDWRLPGAVLEERDLYFHKLK